MTMKAESNGAHEKLALMMAEIKKAKEDAAAAKKIAEEVRESVEINKLMQNFIASEAAEAAAEDSFINDEAESDGDDAGSDVVFVGETIHTTKKRRRA